MEKWLIVVLGQERYKMSLQQLFMPENKEVLGKKKNQTHNDGGMSEISQWPKLGQFQQQNKVVLNYIQSIK